MTRRCLALAAAVLVPHFAPAVEHYVDLYSTNATPPYTNWVTAASNIQHAIDECGVGDVVWVSNGVYDTGSAAGSDGWPSRVVAESAIRIRSVNGTNVTHIKGDASTRCVYLGVGAMLSGFTLTNGSANVGSHQLQGFGGGAFLQSATISNCFVIANRATSGGGVYGGTVADCTIRTNWAEDVGGGTYQSTVRRSRFSRNNANHGGGAYDGTIEDCYLELNRAVYRGGGIAGGVARRCTMWNNRAQEGGGCSDGNYYNCLVFGNFASSQGGGVDYADLWNCTVCDNLAQGLAGGARITVLNNCILYNNAVVTGSDSNHTGCSISNSCTAPLPAGDGNIATNPLFVAVGDYRLQTNSPCIDRGTNLAEIVDDIQGVARPLDGNNDGTARHDMGAYEFVHPLADTDGDRLRDTNEIVVGTSPILWDTDGDRYGDGDELGADSNPWDSSSYLAVTNMAARVGPDGIVLTWQSVTSRHYAVERTLTLVNDNDAGVTAYTNIAANLEGMEGSTVYTDTTAAISQPAFYRVLASP